jgi:hypothetical protein
MFSHGSVAGVQPGRQSETVRAAPRHRQAARGVSELIVRLTRFLSYLIYVCATIHAFVIDYPDRKEGEYIIVVV